MAVPYPTAWSGEFHSLPVKVSSTLTYLTIASVSTSTACVSTWHLHGQLSHPDAASHELSLQTYFEQSEKGCARLFTSVPPIFMDWRHYESSPEPPRSHSNHAPRRDVFCCLAHHCASLHREPHEQFSSHDPNARSLLEPVRRSGPISME